MSNIKDKRAIVPGGSSGIGLATVKMLSAAGAEVVIGCRSGSIDDSIPKVSVKKVDVLDREEMKAFFTDIGMVD